MGSCSDIVDIGLDIADFVLLPRFEGDKESRDNIDGLSVSPVTRREGGVVGVAMAVIDPRLDIHRRR